MSFAPGGGALSEAAIQALIGLAELADPAETSNNIGYSFRPRDEGEAKRYFRIFALDWRDGRSELEDGGLVDGSFSLTERGLQSARALRRARPPIYYWYRQYYSAVATSDAHAEFCRQLHGEDLSQDGFSDATQLDALVAEAGIREGTRVLDLGCGNGRIAERISDSTGALFRGIDYIPEAIAQAVARSEAKRERLRFSVGNLDDFSVPRASFDVAMSIDTLYMPNDLPATLGMIREALAPEGRLAAFYSQFAWGPGADRAKLRPDGTDLAEGLRAAGMPYRTLDFSAANHELMRRKNALACESRGAYQAEGNLFIADILEAASVADEAPYDPDTSSMARYLYIAGEDS